MQLDQFSNPCFDRGASKLKELLWLVISSLFFESFLPGSRWRVALLRSFGAVVGRGVVIKPRVRVKFPWKLTVGDYCWLGEEAWIDNLVDVDIGSHVCVSQGVYLCTGSHDWSRQTFDLVAKSISVKSHAWLGAMSRVAPGVVIHDGAVLGLGSVAKSDLQEWSIYFGCPAVFVRQRISKDKSIQLR